MTYRQELAGSIIPPDLAGRTTNPMLQIATSEQVGDWDPRLVVESIIWGWKRDSVAPTLSRIVYFSGEIAQTENAIYLKDCFFFYAHWGEQKEIASLVTQISNTSLCTGLAASTDYELIDNGDRTTMLRIVSGKPTEGDVTRLCKLAFRLPAFPQPTPPLLSSCDEFDLRRHGIVGADLLAGSGLSYESGLPMLKAVHDLFYVDDSDVGFCLGAKDPLPGILFSDTDATFRRFAQWHVCAAQAKPSMAHQYLAKMRRCGFLHNIYTDNIDKLFCAVGIYDFIRVRGSGVVNEFFPTTFNSRSNALLVVGVSADRRGIIAQARQQGFKIVVVNPYEAVSPGAKNLDYLENGDIFFRLKAGEAIPRIATETLE